MRIRALPISEWSTGEVCGHVCKRGSRNRRVSGICVVSTLAVCVRSSLNAGPVDVSGRRWSATNDSNGSSRVGFRPRARVGHPLSSTEGYLSRHSHRVLQPPAKPVPATGHHRYTENRSHESAQRRSMGGRGLWHRHTARARRTARGGDLARVQLWPV